MKFIKNLEIFLTTNSSMRIIKMKFKNIASFQKYSVNDKNSQKYIILNVFAKRVSNIFLL